MKLLKNLGLLVFFVIFSCSNDDSSNDNNELYTFVNNGGGAVTTLSNSGDVTGLGVAQAVPAVQNEIYPKSLPILLFLNDKVYFDSLKGNFEVTQNDELIGGTIYINEAANGYAILTFVPKNTFSSNSTIVLTLKNGIQDASGNHLNLDMDYTLSFQTNSQDGGNFDDNLSFENGDDGVLFLGDGNILSGTQGCVSPTDGNSFAAITSGNSLVSSQSSIGQASSMMILGTISNGFSSINFDYNFLSSEFQEYVDSEFDDSVMITIVGTDNVYSEFLTSVNTVGTNNTQCSDFAGMPDDGDNYSGETGWMTKTINFGNVGNDALVIFTITDVSDTIYSSAFTLDNVSFNN
ncbi:Ig-like domain-containing protein [Winogradskyella pulchriflava]|uniref:Ig-like domain-containing protein n=1 Tax=Winogradskyella pulchriflava TaxID=1110688 RepID=A0ABV6QBN6_9FLAO